MQLETTWLMLTEQFSGNDIGQFVHVMTVAAAVIFASKLFRR
jgi:hypothetical protein